MCLGAVVEMFDCAFIRYGSNAECTIGVLLSTYVETNQCMRLRHSIAQRKTEYLAPNMTSDIALYYVTSVQSLCC